MTSAHLNIQFLVGGYHRPQATPVALRGASVKLRNVPVLLFLTLSLMQSAKAADPHQAAFTLKAVGRGADASDAGARLAGLKRHGVTRDQDTVIVR